MSDAVPPGEPSDLAPAKAAVQALLTAIIKIALVGDGAEIVRWRGEAQQAADKLRGLGAMSAIKLDAIWAKAVRAAEQDPTVRSDETVNPTLPTMSPLQTYQLTAEPFDLDDLVHTVRDTASFG